MQDPRRVRPFYLVRMPSKRCLNQAIESSLVTLCAGPTDAFALFRRATRYPGRAMTAYCDTSARVLMSVGHERSPFRKCRLPGRT
jgi:hypothetical protein